MVNLRNFSLFKTLDRGSSAKRHFVKGAGSDTSKWVRLGLGALIAIYLFWAIVLSLKNGASLSGLKNETQFLMQLIAGARFLPLRGQNYTSL